MSEWKECKLGDVCEFQEGYVNPSQNFSEYFDGNIKWLRATDLNNGNVYNTSRTLTEKGFLSAGKSAKLFKPNTIGISKSGTIGRLGILKDYMCGNRAVINIAPSEKVNTQFIYYNLLNRQDQFEHLAVGSVQKNLYVPILAELKIKLPSLSTQNEIAKKLSALDDKIELNNQINRNLEEQVKTLYTKLFVKERNGKEGLLGKLISIKYGKDHKKLSDGQYPVYGSGGIMRYVDQFLYDQESVLIPRKGSLNNVMYVNEPFWSVDTMFYTEMKRPNIAKYIFIFLSNQNLESLNAGSAVPSMTTDILNAMKILIPNNDVLAEFENFAAPIYRKITDNARENKELASIRDSLLPRLMSGELGR